MSPVLQREMRVGLQTGRFRYIRFDVVEENKAQVNLSSCGELKGCNVKRLNEIYKKLDQGLCQRKQSVKINDQCTCGITIFTRNRLKMRRREKSTETPKSKIKDSKDYKVVMGRIGGT